MADALKHLGGLADQVQPLFVSVDPARDGANELADYVAHFHPSLIGLTGEVRQIRDISRAYRVHRHKVVLNNAEDDHEYLVDHGSLIYLMGRDGEFVTLFPHGSDPAFMAKAIRRYVL